MTVTSRSITTSSFDSVSRYNTPNAARARRKPPRRIRRPEEGGSGERKPGWPNETAGADELRTRTLQDGQLLALIKVLDVLRHDVEARRLEIDLPGGTDGRLAVLDEAALEQLLIPLRSEDVLHENRALHPPEDPASPPVDGQIVHVDAEGGKDDLLPLLRALPMEHPSRRAPTVFAGEPPIRDRRHAVTEAIQLAP